MNWLDSTLFGIAAWRVCAAIAVVLSYAAYKLYSHRQSKLIGDSPRATSSPAKARKTGVARGAKPGAVVNLTDTQRIDQLHKLVSLKSGERADLKELTFGYLPRLQVIFAGVEHASGQDFARIKVELGGAAANCGSSVQEVGENEFLVPRSTSGDQQCLIHYTCNKSDAVSFLQLRVAKFDAVDRSAAIDVMHVRGRRAA